MKRKLGYLKHYTLKESIILLWSLFIDTLHRKIPHHIFLIKNAFESPALNNARFKREQGEVVITVNQFHYRLRLFSSDFKVFRQIVMEEELKPFDN